MNKYRIATARAKWHDYSANGVYSFSIRDEFIIMPNHLHAISHINNIENKISIRSSHHSL